MGAPAKPPPPPSGRRYSVVDIIAAVAAVCAAVGGFLAYAHAESKAIARDEVALHAARPAHADSIRKHAELEAKNEHQDERIGRLESQALVMSEILGRIENKIDTLSERRHR